MTAVKNSLVVRCVDFTESNCEIAFIRNTVFVEELHIPKELEWDDLDENAHHFIVSSNQNPILAYARLLPNGKLGRVAVLTQWRNQGIGSLLVSEICENATKLNIKTIELSSQITAIDFYLKLGFEITGDIFTEAGIEHRSMHKTLR